MSEILNRELDKDEELMLRESLTTWKEGVFADLLEEVEELKTKKIEELEELNRQYQSELKEEFASKLVSALNEMRNEIRTEVVSEMVSSNPELLVLEKIKELVAPTINEEYCGNIYAEEIKSLREENEFLKRQTELSEGADTLAELIAPYSEKTQNIILAMIKEGNSEEVTEQFYSLIESLGEAVDDDEEDYDEDDDYDDDDYEDEDDDDYEDEDDEDDEFEESYDDNDSYIKEEVEEKVSKKLSLKSQIAGLAN